MAVAFSKAWPGVSTEANAFQAAKNETALNHYLGHEARALSERVSAAGRSVRSPVCPVRKIFLLTWCCLASLMVLGPCRPVASFACCDRKWGSFICAHGLEY